MGAAWARHAMCESTLKWPGSEFDHSPPSREKNEWSCTSAVTVWLHGTDREDFVVPLLYRLTEMLIIAVLIKVDLNCVSMPVTLALCL
jgi:hypothetical protein